MTPTRRGLITGFASLLAAPAIVRVTSIMPVKAVPLPPQMEFVEAFERMHNHQFHFQRMWEEVAELLRVPEYMLKVRDLEPEARRRFLTGADLAGHNRSAGGIP